MSEGRINKFSEARGRGGPENPHQQPEPNQKKLYRIKRDITFEMGDRILRGKAVPLLEVSRIFRSAGAPISGEPGTIICNELIYQGYIKEWNHGKSVLFTKKMLTWEGGLDE